MKQCLDNVTSMLKLRWNDVVQRWKTTASTLSDVDSTLLQHQTLSRYDVRFCFIFNVGSSPRVPFSSKPSKESQRTTKGIVYRNGSQFKRLYGIVIRIYKLSSVCLPYCIYFVSFPKLKQCTDWYKSGFDDGFTRKLLDSTHILAFKNHSLWQRTIMTFPRGFPKFLCSSANVSNLRKFREQTVLTDNGNCHLDMFQ